MHSTNFFGSCGLLGMPDVLMHPRTHNDSGFYALLRRTLAELTVTQGTLGARGSQVLSQ